MSFAAIVDVINKTLAEPLPASTCPILLLAKTDQQKRSKFKADDYSDEENAASASAGKFGRRSWTLQVNFSFF